jgi:hypothetical protein
MADEKADDVQSDPEWNPFAGIPGISVESAASTAVAAQYFSDNYEIIVNREMSEIGEMEYLGAEPKVCRFCDRGEDTAQFKKVAHAIPELTGNRTLARLNECDDCNARFSAFEDDLGTMTLLARLASQVSGKQGVPTVTGKRKSRVDLGDDGFNIASYDNDPIFEIDEESQTYTLTVAERKYRPLGVYKALVKCAISVMDDTELLHVKPAIQWLRAKDLTTDAVSGGGACLSFQSFTPGPRPFALTYARLLKRKTAIDAPMYIFVLAFGNSSYQIIVPSTPDLALEGRTVSVYAMPIFDWLEHDRVKGPTKWGKQLLDSPDKKVANRTATFHFDKMTHTPGTGSGAAT